MESEGFHVSVRLRYRAGSQMLSLELLSGWKASKERIPEDNEVKDPRGWWA